MDRIIDNFSLDEKIKNFDILIENYYDNNFGRLSKADFELLMYKFYEDNCFIRKENKLSDFDIGKRLGITPQKVRTLQLKRQLIYPSDIKLIDEIGSILETAKYNKNDKKIEMIIERKYIFLELKNYVEKKGQGVDIQLNEKMFKIPLPYFIDLLYNFCNDVERQKKY